MAVYHLVINGPAPDGYVSTEASVKIYTDDGFSGPARMKIETANGATITLTPEECSHLANFINDHIREKKEYVFE